MAKTVDMELKKAFSELQHKLLDTKQKLKLADIQIESHKMAKQRAELTALEIKNLAEKIDYMKTYVPCGRMFVLRETPTVVEDLLRKASMCNTKIGELEGNKAYLDKSLKESENNLREMVQQRKEKQEK